VNVIQKPLLFSGNSNSDLAREIAQKMETRLGSALVDKFRNEECRIEIRENVRGAEVFLVQSLCKAPNGQSVNDSLMELLLMIDALNRASAGRITAVIPYFGYAKQDKKTKGREPISAKLVANMIEAAGAKRVVTLDLHAAQIQGFFDLPVDNLEAAPTLSTYLKSQGLEGDRVVIVSPDAGGVTRAEKFAKRLRSSLAIVFKRRPEPDVSEVTEIVGDVSGKIAVVVDDMISTGGTLAKAAEALIKRGATEVYTCATHGIFAGDAVRVLTESPISKVVVTNTIPFDAALLNPKFQVLSIAQILADAIKRITANRSVSELFARDEDPGSGPPGDPGPGPPGPMSQTLELPEVLTPAS
jgi:ribose-phosphate pyrophosphokinase